jgi:hypothetical protein
MTIFPLFSPQFGRNQIGGPKWIIPESHLFSLQPKKGKVSSISIFLPPPPPFFILSIFIPTKHSLRSICLKLIVDHLLITTLITVNLSSTLILMTCYIIEVDSLNIITHNKYYKYVIRQFFTKYFKMHFEFKPKNCV